METDPKPQNGELRLAGDEVSTLLTESAFNSPERYSALVMNYLIARFATATCVYARCQTHAPEYVLRTVLPSSSRDFRAKLLTQFGESASESDFFQRWVALHNHTHGPIISDAELFGIGPKSLAKLWQQSMKQILNWANFPSFHGVFHPLTVLDNDIISRPHIILPLQAAAFQGRTIWVTLQPQFIISAPKEPFLRVVDYRTFLPSQSRIQVALLHSLAAQEYMMIPYENRKKGGQATTISPIDLDFLDPCALLPYTLNLLGLDGKWEVETNILNGRPKFKDRLLTVKQLLINSLTAVVNQKTTEPRNKIFWTPQIAPFFPTEAELQKYEPNPNEEQLKLQFPEP